MQPTDIILEHRCCLTNQGRHFMVAGCVLGGGMAAFDTVLYLCRIEPSVPGEPSAFWWFALIPLLFGLAIQIFLPVAFVWLGFQLRKVGGEFVCQLSEQQIVQFDPAGLQTFSLRLADIDHIEDRYDGDGGHTWILWGNDGAKRQLTAYDNPADEFVEKILELQPGIEVRNTTG